jgi:uncharacterized protein YjbI with pentapeptide repeats
MKVEIKSRWDSSRVLFTAEVDDSVASGLAMRHALEQAVSVRPRLFLRGAVLSDADLSGADLSGAVLRGAVLSDADLRGAVLSDADLSGAVLSGADLSGAVLSGAVLRGAVLSDADLSGAVLRGADLSDAVLSDADLSDADLSDADLSGADLSGADLSGAVLSGADLSGAVLSDADLSGADGKPLPRATPEQAIENLDKVREIVLDSADRLNMGHWHGDEAWRGKTCAEEVLCGTTHCLAGWLQVCTTEQALKGVSAQLAGALAAPVASKMFFRPGDVALEWLKNRKYVEEIAESERRSAERKARKAARGAA